MSEQVDPNMKYLVVNNDNTDLVSIKEEMVQDDDVLLFTPADMEEYTMINNVQSDEIVNAENVDTLNTDLKEFLSKYQMDAPDKPNTILKYKLHNGKPSKVWECGMCAKEFGHQYTLMRHLPTHTDERKFQCNTCGKAFRQMSTLSQHRAIHSSERPYICEICRKTFNRVSTLISHRKTHTGIKPHRCNLCNKAFHQKGNLRNHIFTHTNERPYKCDVCSKGFNQMSNLMCHKMKAHHRTEKPHYICQICGKEFQKRLGLRNHEQFQHGVQNNNPITSTSNTPPKYTTGIIIDPINTKAMQLAVQTNQTPFALLKPLKGIPVLVRVLAAEDKQMIVPATADDLKKYGQITITHVVDEEKSHLSTINSADIETKDIDPIDNPQILSKSLGSTVKLKIPIVATVTQRRGEDGNMCVAIESPGPENAMNENCCISTGMIHNYANSVLETEFVNANVENAEIQYVDEYGNLVNTDDCKTRGTFLFQNYQFEPQDGMITSNIHIENGIDQETTVQDLDKENLMNINILGDSSNPIYGVLEKQENDAVTSTATVLDNNNGLFESEMASTFTFP